VSARIEYPWHPLHGQVLRVVQRLTRGGTEILWLEERPGLCRELPVWMCDAAACLGMAQVGPPRVGMHQSRTGYIFPVGVHVIVLPW
jgi:hypothetical protein